MILNKYKFGHLLFLVVVCALGILSCKKYDNPALIFQDYTTDSINTKTRKILIIGIDGVSSSNFQAIKPDFLTNEIFQHSKYSLSVQDEQVNNDVTAWTAWATGTSYMTNEVSDSSFSPVPDLSDPDAGSSLPANLLSYIIRNKPLAKTQVITPWSGMNNLLFRGANKKVTVSDDVVVKDSTVKLISSTSSDLSIIEFNSAALAGLQSGFSNSNPNFVSAINNIDGYVKEIVAAIKSRSSYSKENWLIMLASNKGPDGLNTGNTFMLAYNDKFSKEEMLQNGDGVPRFTANTSYATTPSSTATDYDISATSERTISFKINVSQYGSLNPGIILKTESSANSKVGWWIIHNGSNGTFRFVLNGGSAKTIATTTIVPVNEWHTVTAKVYFSGTKRYSQIYLDGVPQATALDVTGVNCTSISPLRVGVLANTGSGSYSGGTTLESITDIRIYDIALPDDTIAKNACKMYLDNGSDSYYAHLISYWPANEAIGAGLYNMAPNMSENVLTYIKPLWQYGALAGNNVCYTSPYIYDPTKTYSITSRNCDIAAVALDWLRISIDDSWGLDGVSWISNFEREYSVL